MAKMREHGKLIPGDKDQLDSRGVLLDAEPVLVRGEKTFFRVGDEKLGAGKKPARAVIIVTVSIATISAALLMATSLRKPAARALDFGQASEIQPLIEFNTALFSLEDRLRVAESEYQRSRSNADRKRDLLILFDASNNYEDALRKVSLQASAVALPQLSVRASTRWARRALDVFEARLNGMQAENHLVVEAVDRGQLRPVGSSPPVGQAEKLSEQQALALRRSYEALGLDPPEINAIQRRIEHTLK